MILPRVVPAPESSWAWSLCSVPFLAVSALAGVCSCRSCELWPPDLSRILVRKAPHYRKVSRSPLSRGVLKYRTGAQGETVAVCVFIGDFPTGHKQRERATTECLAESAICQLWISVSSGKDQSRPSKRPQSGIPHLWIAVARYTLDWLAAFCLLDCSLGLLDCFMAVLGFESAVVVACCPVALECSARR